MSLTLHEQINILNGYKGSNFFQSLEAGLKPMIHELQIQVNDPVIQGEQHQYDRWRLKFLNDLVNGDTIGRAISSLNNELEMLQEQQDGKA